MKLILGTQQIAGILSPIILTFMLILINDKAIMGKHVNTKTQNLISWITILFIITLSAIWLLSPIF